MSPTFAKPTKTSGYHTQTSSDIMVSRTATRKQLSCSNLQHYRRVTQKCVCMSGSVCVCVSPQGSKSAMCLHKIDSSGLVSVGDMSQRVKQMLQQVPVNRKRGKNVRWRAVKSRSDRQVQVTFFVIFSTTSSCNLNLVQSCTNLMICAMTFRSQIGGHDVCFQCYVFMLCIDSRV